MVLGERGLPALSPLLSDEVGVSVSPHQPRHEWLEGRLDAVRLTPRGTLIVNPVRFKAWLRAEASQVA